MPSPLRTRVPVFYPTQLNLYRRCPERYFHEKVERRRVEEGFSPALAKGNAVHTILAECFEIYRHDGIFPADLLNRAEYYLPRGPYPHDQAWHIDVATIVAQVEFGLNAFDRTAEVLATEATYDYLYPGSASCPPFTLRAKVDRVTRNPDGGLEHTDYKTGGSCTADAVQNIASRIVVGQNFPGDFPYIRSTTMFLASQSSRSDDLTREEVSAVWKEIKQIVRSILASDAWQPKRSVLCEYCPFYGTGCTLDPAEGAGIVMAEWLDGVA